MNKEQNQGRTRRRIGITDNMGTYNSAQRPAAREPMRVTATPGGKYEQSREAMYTLRNDPQDANNSNNYRRSYVPDTGQERNKTVSTEPKTNSKAREVLSWVLSIGLAVVAAFLIRAFLFEIILVEGHSMEPTLLTDERIAIEKVSRYAGLPSRGDIIIVEYPDMDGTYVKRTIGLPGETVEVRDSTVYINGVPLNEDYISSEPFADMEPFVVPEDHVFVMGDNRAHSMDSRTSYVGPISKDAIIGHGLFVLWPFDNIHMINEVTNYN